MIKPLGNKILITPDQSDSTLFGDMEMPDSAVEKPVTGVVLSVGPKVDQSFVKEGDKVAYSPHAVVTIEVWGEKVSYVREDDIVLVYSNS